MPEDTKDRPWELLEDAVEERDTRRLEECVDTLSAEFSGSYAPRR